MQKFNWKGFFQGAFISILFLTALFFLFTTTQTYENIFYPAYLSVASVCFPNGAEYVESKGYTQGGQFNLTDQTITIFVPDFDGSVNRHELCHKKQYSEGKIYTCSNMLFMFFNEIEAYGSEYSNHSC
jgi:hypothetical protein